MLPESAQTKDTGTLAEYLTSLGVEVSEIDLDEEEDDFYEAFDPLYGGYF